MGAKPAQSRPRPSLNAAAPNQGPGSRGGISSGTSRSVRAARSDVPSRSRAVPNALTRSPAFGCPQQTSGGMDGARATSANAAATRGLAVCTHAMFTPSACPARKGSLYLVSKHSETSDATDSDAGVGCGTERGMNGGPHLVLRESRPEGTQVPLGAGLAVGGSPFIVMAGPCAVEDAAQIADA